MYRFECEMRGVTFVVQYEGPANVTPAYKVFACRGKNVAKGRVSYASLSRERAVVSHRTRPLKEAGLRKELRGSVYLEGAGLRASGDYA